MVNQEILGGLISALSRGESLKRAMFSMFNAGYKKEEIEEAARILQSQSPVQISQKIVEDNKNKIQGKMKPQVQPKTPIQVNPEIKQKIQPKTPIQNNPKVKPNKKMVSSYGEQQNPEEFNKIIQDTIESLRKLDSPVEVVESNSKSKPSIIIQRVSGYETGKVKPTSKVTIFILFTLLILLLGALVALFIFKGKIIEILNNFSF